jgi:hypothetical protein
MQDARIIEGIRVKYIELLDDLDERGRRRWAAVEARALGRGGITAVARATGLSDRTIRTGLRELDDPDALPSHRQRRSGGGRKSSGTVQPGLQQALDRLIEPTSRGSPTHPLRWTIKSTRRLAERGLFTSGPVTVIQSQRLANKHSERRSVASEGTPPPTPVRFSRYPGFIRSRSEARPDAHRRADEPARRTADSANCR